MANPYLPSWEYIPDGEPRVFGDRIYVYGSHDRVDSDASDIDWSEKCLYAPDVVEKDGKYYLYAYILDSKGCVAVSDKPEGPFELVSRYEYNIPDHYDNGTFIDPGVLVDDDGRVYVYCGYGISLKPALRERWEIPIT